MRVLIAIMTCEALRHRADVQRRTWVRDVVGADVKFFLARNGHNPLPDEVHLDVPDDYLSLRPKVQAMCNWALAQGYDFIFKTDDDTLVIPRKLLASGFQQYDYAGRYRGPSGTYPCHRDNVLLPNGVDLYGTKETGFAS